MSFHSSPRETYFFANSKRANLCFFVKGGHGCNFRNSALGMELKAFRIVRLVHGRFRSRTISGEDIFLSHAHPKTVDFRRLERVLGRHGRLHLLYTERFFKKLLTITIDLPIDREMTAPLIPLAFIPRIFPHSPSNNYFCLGIVISSTDKD